MASFGLLGAVGGLGQGLSAVGEDIRRNDNADASAGRQQALEAWKMKTAEAYKISAEQRAQAPLNRLSAAAQAKAGEEVPLESAPVRTLAADNSLKTGGMAGDYDTLVAQAANLPEADRAPYLAQLEQQRGRAQTAADESVVGKTRKRSNDEALDSAMSDARLKDPQAYMAGKSLIGDKTVTVADGATVIDPRTGKVIYSGAGAKDARIQAQEDRRDDREANREEGRDRRQQAYLDAQERLAEKRARGGSSGGDISKEERLRYTNLFTEAGRQMISGQKALSKLRSDTMYSIAKPGDPKYQELEDLKGEIANYKKERGLYGALLAGSGVAGAPDVDDGSVSTPAAAPAKNTPAPAPASDNRKAPLPALPAGAKKVGTSGGKPVWETPDGRRFVEN